MTLTEILEIDELSKKLLDKCIRADANKYSFLFDDLMYLLVEVIKMKKEGFVK